MKSEEEISRNTYKRRTILCVYSITKTALRAGFRKNGGFLGIIGGVQESVQEFTEATKADTEQRLCIGMIVGHKILIKEVVL